MKFKEVLKAIYKLYEVSIVRSPLDSPIQDLQLCINSKFLFKFVWKIICPTLIVKMLEISFFEYIFKDLFNKKFIIYKLGFNSVIIEKKKIRLFKLLQKIENF